MAVILSWLVGGLIMGLYVFWFIARYRRDQRKKSAEESQAQASTDAIFRARLAEISPDPPLTRSPVPEAPSVPGFSLRGTTVAEALSGIVMPNDLVPLTTMAAIPVSGDRVAFWTDTASAAVVGPAFASEVERLGYSMTPIDQQTIALLRGDNNLVVTIHPDGRAAVAGGEPLYPTVPAGAVVLDVRVVF